MNIDPRTDKPKIILHLCAKHGSDSLPYKEAGYDVRIIGEDIGVQNYHPPKNVYGIIANPPCTMFSIARSKAKTPRDLREGMYLVRECLRVIWECQYDINKGQRSSNLKFWCIENPATGMLRFFLGNPTFRYCHSEYGEPHTKRTALWGLFNHPIKPLLSNPLPPYRSLCGDIIKIAGNKNSDERMQMRSMAPKLFTKLFFDANQ